VLTKTRLPLSVIKDGSPKKPQWKKFPTRPSATEFGPLELTPLEIHSQSGESSYPNGSETMPTSIFGNSPSWTFQTFIRAGRSRPPGQLR
jgi:hypothetical protein